MDGFLRNFHKWKEAKGLPDKVAAIRLRGALRDAAKEHKENVEYSGAITLQAVEQELRAAFGGAA